MANPTRGEVAITAGGKEYTLRLTVNAAAILERAAGLTFNQVITQIRAESVRHMVMLLWVSLQAKHAAEFRTQEQAAALVDTGGDGTLISGIAWLSNALAELLNANQPPAALQTADGGEGADPPMAGTGSDSSSTPGA